MQMINIKTEGRLALNTRLKCINTYLYRSTTTAQNYREVPWCWLKKKKLTQCRVLLFYFIHFIYFFGP